MGSGYRTFTAGEVLTASNVQDYLMDQSVMVFADSTARATNIGTANFEEGMVSYLEDSDTVEVYDGSAWASIAPASTSGLTLINTTSFSGVSSISVNNVFTATYTNYKIIFDTNGMTNTLTANLDFRLRASGSDDSTSSYGRQGYNSDSALANRSDVATSFNVNQLRTGTSFRSFHILEILKPQKLTNTNFSLNAYSDDASTPFGRNIQGIHQANFAADGFTYLISTGTMTGGTIRVYGYAD